MTTWRRIVPATVAVLVGSLALFLVLRGFRDEPGVPDTGPKVGTVTPDPDPRPLSDEDEGALPPRDGTPSAERVEPPAIAARITGRVQDTSERPIANATVSVRTVDARALRGAPYDDGPVLASVQTERDGAFALDAPGRTWLRLVAAAEGYATVGMRISSTGADVVVELPRAGRLTVEVLDTEGRPLPDARVVASVGEARLETTTDAEGRGEVNALPPGAARLRVGAAGYGTVQAGPFAVRAEETTHALVSVPPGVRLGGRVEDGTTGQAIAGARVFIARPGESSDAGTTDAEGRFAPVAAGGFGERVFVSVDAEGYAPALEPLVLGPPREEALSVRIALEPAGDWVGQVVSAVGRPVAGARVRYTPNGVAGRTPASSVSDEAGQFRLPPPPPPAPGVRVVLVAEIAGQRAALALRPHELQPQPLVLKLADGTSVSGRLVDRDGQGVLGALVRLVPAWDRMARTADGGSGDLLRAANEEGLVGLAASSDAAGRWFVPAVPPGPYALHVRWHGGARWLDLALDVGAQAVDAGTVRLGSGPALEGRVRDPAGLPLAGATVRLADRSGAARGRTVPTDAEGMYAFPDVATGRYRVQATFPTLGLASRDVDVATSTTRVDLDLDDGAVLAGRVTRGDEPYRGVLRLLLRAEGSGAGLISRTLRTKDGAFEVAGIPYGRWNVQVSAPGDLRGQSDGPIEADVGLRPHVELLLVASAALEGRVRTVGDRGVPGARLLLMRQDGAERRLATADAAGHYRVEGLPAGTYEVRAYGETGAPAVETVGLEPGEPGVLDIDLPEGGALRVRVVDGAGRPQAGALVMFRDATGPVPAVRPDRTGRDGVLVRRHLPAGDIHLRARGTRGSGTARASVRTGETTDVTVTLEEASPR